MASGPLWSPRPAAGRRDCQEQVVGKRREARVPCRAAGAVSWDRGGLRSGTSPCPPACCDVPEQELPTRGSTWEEAILLLTKAEVGCEFSFQVKTSPSSPEVAFLVIVPLPKSVSYCYFGFSPRNETRSDPVLHVFFPVLFRKRHPLWYCHLKTLLVWVVSLENGSFASGHSV